MSVLSLSRVDFSYTTRPLLKDVSLRVGPGERVCLVGPNGSGKTTLLRLATGSLTPDNGRVDPVAPPPAAPARSSTVAEALDEANRADLELIARFEELSAELGEGTGADEYDRVLGELTARDVWSLDARTDELVAGMGLGDVDRHREVGTLSPGQQARLHLVCILLASPDALVLDEPTNHLDAAAIDFLAQTVADFSGPVLLTSHDRYFIESTATAVADLDTESWRALALAEGRDPVTGLHRQKGAYSDFLRAKDSARRRHREIHESQQADKQAILRHQADSETVGHKTFTPKSETRMAKKFYADRAQKVSTRRITDDQRRLDALADKEVRKPRFVDFDFAIPDAPATSGMVVSVQGRGVEKRLRPVTFELAAGEALVVTGPNGAGKSTLLELVATDPTITGARVAWVRQDLPEEGEAIGEAGKGFLHPKFWDAPVAELSDGNRRRAQLARAVAEAPEVLVIDEPTNYLDLDAIEALERSLREWNGTVVMATHDRWLLETFPAKRLEL